MPSTWVALYSVWSSGCSGAGLGSKTEWPRGWCIGSGVVSAMFICNPEHCHPYSSPEAIEMGETKGKCKPHSNLGKCTVTLL